MNIKVEHSGEMIIIHLSGSLNIDNLFDVEKAMLGEVEAGARLMAVYCKNLGSLDSSAIGFFVKFFKYTTERGILLVICDLNPLLLRLFATARLDRYFKIMTRADFEVRYCA